MDDLERIVARLAHLRDVVIEFDQAGSADLHVRRGLERREPIDRRRRHAISEVVLPESMVDPSTTELTTGRCDEVDPEHGHKRDLRQHQMGGYLLSAAEVEHDVGCTAGLPVGSQPAELIS